MNLPTQLRFLLVNGLNEEDVSQAPFVIYMHTCDSGRYIGFSNDPVKRWQEHYSDAFNEHSHNTDDKFRDAIRKHKNQFKHYIVAVAAFEASARKKEAVAIDFYNGNLNSRSEKILEFRDYGFRKTEGQLEKALILSKKPSNRTSSERSDSDRKTIVAEIFLDGGRKRLRSTAGQAFPEGLSIECSREERNRFHVGDKVKVNVALSEKSNGTKYLTAAKTSILVKVG